MNMCVIGATATVIVQMEATKRVVNTVATWMSSCVKPVRWSDLLFMAIALR